MSSKPEVTEAVPQAVSTTVQESLVDREVRNPFLRFLMHLGLPLSVSVILHVGVVAFLALKTFDVLTRPKIEIGEWEGSVVEADQMRSAFQWADEDVLETPDAAPLDDSLDSLATFQGASDFDLSDLDARALGGDGSDGSVLGLGDGSLRLIGTGSGAGEAGSGGFGAGFGVGGAGIGRAGIWI